MISAEDIRNITFKKSGFGGYKPIEVDSFLDDVQVSYERLQHENAQLTLKVEELNKQLEKYKAEESCIRSAILSAQKLADASLLDADNKAKSVLLEASRKADEIIYKAKAEVENQKEISWNMHVESQKFQSKLIRMYEEQLNEVKKFCESDNKKYVAEVNNALEREMKKGDTTEQNEDILPIEFNKHEESDVLPIEDIEELNDKVPDADNVDIIEDIYSGSDIEDVDSATSTKKIKLKNLKFGAKYRTDGQEVEKGIYSGLFKHKK